MRAADNFILLIKLPYAFSLLMTHKCDGWVKNDFGNSYNKKNIDFTRLQQDCKAQDKFVCIQILLLLLCLLEAVAVGQENIYKRELFKNIKEDEEV
ncbi:CLUMA_CG012274, isoform A [Clunio marinus]|uniref:CLUMA_CG012274, isoform A n=1 Tax=Clunio marinus TaxID=568069 RepID=A0A1J1IHT2_9DIPT|nr:CLUMA_CG012274, isoform A [Clunio marinus]